MPRTTAGFTLIELLVVIAVVGLLAGVLVPMVRQGGGAAESAADAMQLRTHFGWLELHRRQHNGALPDHGGHRFVLATWPLVDPTPENLDRYFSPGARDQDAHYQQLRSVLLKGGTIWQDLGQCSTQDTTYCGRAREHLKTARHSDGEALMANANDGMSTLRDGSVNILLSSGQVRTLSPADLRELTGGHGREGDPPVRTWGPDSPIAACRTLAR